MTEPPPTVYFNGQQLTLQPDQSLRVNPINGNLILRNAQGQALRVFLAGHWALEQIPTIGSQT